MSTELKQQRIDLALDWFVIESGTDVEVQAKVVQGIQHGADELHRQMCACAGLRWIDCEVQSVKGTIDSLFSIEEWTLDVNQQPFLWQIHYEDGYVRVVHLSEVIVPSRMPALQEVRFSVPLIPPSVNHYKQPKARGGWYITAEAKAFIDAVPVFARSAAPKSWPWFGTDPQTKHGKPERIFYEVELTFHIHRSRYLAGDSDNLEKVAFDALTTCGAITDDRYVKYHSNRAMAVESLTEQRTEYVVRIVGEP